MSNLIIPRNLLKELVSHCRRELPREACGLLAGKGRRVTMVMPMPNVASDPKNHYVVEGVAQQHAFRIMEEKGLDFVGVYHSHPRGAAVPSLTDIRQSIGNDVIHVIVSLRWKEAVIKAYRLFRDSDRYLRVNIDVTGSKGASRFRTSGTRNLRAFRAGDTLDADQWRDWRVWTSGGSY